MPPPSLARRQSSSSSWARALMRSRMRSSVIAVSLVPAIVAQAGNTCDDGSREECTRPRWRPSAHRHAPVSVARRFSHPPPTTAARRSPPTQGGTRMDNILGSVLGGQQDQQQFQDFAQRYQQGAPWDGISDDEALSNYNKVAGTIPPDVYEQSARESFDRLQPQQREELGQVLMQRAPQFGVQVPQAQPSQLQDSGFLAQMTGQ